MILAFGKIMRLKLYYLLAHVLLLCGCTTYSYVNDVEPSETRRIDPASASRLPKKLTVAQLFRAWGPGGAGKELIYLYRSKSDTEQIYAMAAPPTMGNTGRLQPGDADVIKIVLFRQESSPVIIWESEIKNAEIDRLLKR
jgi:hypothetical protein